MVTPRGWAVVAGGVVLYVASRAVGSPNLHMAALGLLVLPLFAALFLRLGATPLHVSRRPATKRAVAGSRVRVDVTVENRGRRGTPVILLEDRVPPALGRPARAVLPGIPARSRQTVGYLMSCRRRGRYELGPARLLLSDPFGLARLAIRSPETHELVVYPELEELSAWPVANYGTGAGESPSHRVFRTGEEFYGMRAYLTGDDLRRIHWPSTARRGQLMIRQEEAARRSSATLLLDTRVAALGKAGAPPFERGVSVAASLAAVFARNGYATRLTTPDLPPAALGEEALLEHLAAVRASAVPTLAPALTLLKGKAISDSTLFVVTAPIGGGELTALIRAGSAYGPKFAVLVHPVEPSSLSDRDRSELERRASATRTALGRAGWEVFLIGPGQTLGETWQRRTTRRLHAAASRS